MTSNAADVDELVAAYLQAAERGDAPDPAEWVARHPAHAAELAAFLADLGRFGPLLGLSAVPPTDLTADFRPYDGPAAGAGRPFGEYELLEELGRGGMGVVYRARPAGTSLVVALKQVRPGAADLARFREEVESAVGLRHPNVVPVYHVGEHDGRPFFTMKLVEGGGLDRHVGRYTGDPTAVARLVATVARAVHHAHQRQVLHRDLKPANILLDEAGEPHVADFGLAARTDEAGALAAGPPAGSLPWMAPEAVRGDPVLTTAVDVWALGAILYELLTGVRPFRGASADELRDAILHRDPPPRAAGPRVPRDLDAVCRRCLAKDPDKRYESASAVALDLERWLRDEPVRARKAGRAERAARWCRRNPGLAAAAVVLGGLLAGGAVLGVRLAEEQARALREAFSRAVENNAVNAASTVHLRLVDMSEPVVRAADDPGLKAACAAATDDRQRQRQIEAVLQGTFAPPAGRRSPFETAYVLDPDGVLVALVELGPPSDAAAGPRLPVVGERFAGRDYFVTAQNYWERDGRDAVHVSRVFHSKADGKDKVALSCPLHPGPRRRRKPWVVAATVAADANLGLGHLQREDQKTSLLVPRDPNGPHPGREGEPAGYEILIHEGFPAGADTVPFPPGRPAPVLPPADGHELPPVGDPNAQLFPRTDDYRDPAADHGYPEYAGRWLAGSARVGNTGLVVVVQQKATDAVAPQTAFFGRLAAWAGGVVGAAALALATVGLARIRRGAGRRPES